METGVMQTLKRLRWRYDCAPTAAARRRLVVRRLHDGVYCGELRAPDGGVLVDVSRVQGGRIVDVDVLVGSSAS